MKCRTTIKMNTFRLSQLSRAGVTSLEKTAEAVHTDIVQAQVMPFDTGNLQNESTFVDNSSSSRGRVQIVFSTPYARRLYYHPEYNFKTSENPFAGAQWCQPWLPGGLYENFAKQAFKKFYRREGGL